MPLSPSKLVGGLYLFLFFVYDYCPLLEEICIQVNLLSAQQEAERSKFVVMKSEQERRAAVIKAEGEAESARLIIDSLKSQGPGDYKILYINNILIS